MGFHKIIGDAMLGRTTPEQAGQQAALLMGVQRVMFCPLETCGVILDRARAVLLEINGTPKALMCGDCFDRIKGNIAAKGGEIDPSVTVTDGRTLSW